MDNGPTIQFFVGCRRRYPKRVVHLFYSEFYDDHDLNENQQLLVQGFGGEVRAHFEDSYLHINDLNARLEPIQQSYDEYCVSFGIEVHVGPLEEDHQPGHSFHLPNVRSYKDLVPRICASHLRHSWLILSSNYLDHTGTH